MWKRFSRTATNLFLSALVLAWGIVPPAVRHSHEGGEDTRHRHDAVADHGHDHGERGHTGDADSAPAGSDVSPAVLRALVVHLHWSVFGVDFSVPVPEDDQPNDGSNDAELAVVRLVDSVPTPAIDRNGPASIAPMTVAQLGLESAVVPNPPLASFHLTQPVPLCDRARHERSGVLLV
jgi:hypothetical protein